MYQFSPITDRVVGYRAKIRDRELTFDLSRAKIVTESYKRLGNTIPIIKKALTQLDYANQCDLYIGDEELIVGSKGSHMFSSAQYPEWGEFSHKSYWICDLVDAGVWSMEEDGYWHNPKTSPALQRIHPDDVKWIKEVGIPFWQDKACGDAVAAWQPDYYEELTRLRCTSYVPKDTPGYIAPLSLPLGHLVAGYKKIISVGYKAIRDEAQAWLDAHYDRLMGEDVRKYTFYKAAVITCDAAMVFVKRYADAVQEKYEVCTDEARKAELKVMAENLYQLVEGPAKTFWQALQGIMMYQLFYTAETSNPSAALGRVDQYIYPFYEKEIAAGTLTKEFAQELIDMFFLKANCSYGIAPDVVADTTGVGNTWQHTTCGGVDPDTGEDATNDCTYMILETVGRLELHDPTISLRFNKNSPQKLWECAIATSKLVGGLPLYQNDEQIIPGLIRELGFSLHDARDYGVIGCQEIVGCGTDYPAPNGCPPHGSAFWSIIFDMAINNGINPLNGEQSTVQNGYLYEMENIEEVKDAFKAQATHVMNMFASTHNYAEMIGEHTTPQPALSISMEGCMEKGADVAWGGAKYNSYGCTATGLSSCADSITAIKYMCFDKKLCTTRELYDATMANWEGYEDLRQQVINECPHFGNGDSYADMEMKWVTDLYYEICSTMYSTRAKVYKAGLYGASDHVRQGRITWGTPNGRKMPDPIADGSSPVQSCDHCGPTAVLYSSQIYEQGKFMDGVALNIRMHPSVVSNDEGVGKLIDVTRSYFENGGMEVQYNIVDTATLRRAQEHPEDYKDLVVRIAGYSAYFVDMGKDLQEDIIARTENQLS
ncbi:MAG: hypothetical protein IKD88_01095 [Lachnospiraceae bacterium]|nr:hypothetical protein [Lachnospiraceae bacterium]